MQKTLIVLIVGLLAVGCASTPTMKNVAGTYVGTKDGVTAKLVLLDNGIFESFSNASHGPKADRNTRLSKDYGEEVKWKIVDGEIHVGKENESVVVIRVNKDGSITWIAEIEDGEREDVPKEEQFTLKKISSSTIKRLVRPHTNDTDTSPTMKSVVGTYEGSESGGLKLVLHKDGAEVWDGIKQRLLHKDGAEVWEESGTVYDSNCKYVIKDGRIEVTGPRLGSQIFNIESNGNLMWIIEGGRKKSEPVLFKKIK